MATSIFSGLLDEIKTEILARVPAKAVGKFRCLSKKWNSILSSPHFIKLHTSNINKRQPSVILVSQTDMSLHVTTTPFEEPKKVEEFENKGLTILVGSCNGIVLFYSEKDMFLLNPTTLKQVKLPKFTVDKIECPLLTLFTGFGYDKSTDDYKVVIVSRAHTNKAAYLYSMKLGVWKKIRNSFAPFGCFSHSRSHSGLLINGSINWFVVFDKPGILYTILAFDLATEVFREIDIPLNVHGPRPDRTSSVFAHGGCLCSVEQSRSDTGLFDILMMNEYGTVNSWIKSTVVDGWLGIVLSILWVGRYEIVWYYNYDGDMSTHVCYPLEGTEKGMVGFVTSFIDILPFADSLVSLNGFASLVKHK